MVFSSMLFVFVFLSGNLLSQLLLKTTRQKNIAMLVFSILFYSWSGPKYLFLLLGMVLICYVGALWVERQSEQPMKKGCMLVTVALCLLILGIFKYTGFFLENIQGIFGVPKVIPQIVLPIGISFYTFQLISYVVDVYRGEVPAQRQYWMLLLYASLFHQCIAGPIVRYQDVCTDIETRKTSLQEISNGISRFTIGLAKKSILANGCAVIADGFFDVGSPELAVLPALGVMLGALAYMLQIYLDFSAYSDMAIGMGLMCGFHYKENFNYPYMADSAGDFWRRWHISLSTFFRDYVYIPLGGNRKGRNRAILNNFIIFVLTGIWHGSTLNFLFWGIYHGIFVILEKFVLEKQLEKLPKLLRWFLTMLIVYFGWVLFFCPSLSSALHYFGQMFGMGGMGFLDATAKYYLSGNLILLIIAAIGSGSLVQRLHQKIAYWKGGWATYVSVALYVLLILLTVAYLVSSTYTSFLYFQF